jgi:NADH-quinone oxidoreductase subunit I
MAMYGFGLIKGLKVTLFKFFEKKITQQYPEVKPSLPSRSFGSFDFIPEKCISCNICANACPNGVISVECSSGEKGKKVLDNYRMSLSYCLFCGLCIDACPTGALLSKSDFEMAYYDKKNAMMNWQGKSPVMNSSSADGAGTPSTDAKEVK